MRVLLLSNCLQGVAQQTVGDVYFCLSMDGRLVARHKISNMNAEISMNDLQNGTYHVVVYQGNMRSTSVVIVKH